MDNNSVKISLVETINLWANEPFKIQFLAINKNFILNLLTLGQNREFFRNICSLFCSILENSSSAEMDKQNDSNKNFTISPIEGESLMMIVDFIFSKI